MAYLVLVYPALVGLGLSCLLERLVQPASNVFWRRPLAANVIHMGVWLLFFMGELILFQRPWFAAANVWAWTLLVVLVSNAKYRSLREPFIFQDFEYFTDAIKHPRLYLPFLGIGNAILAVLAFCLALFLGIELEPSLLRVLSPSKFMLFLLVLGLSGGALLQWGDKQGLALDLAPKEDIGRLGLVASIWCYGRAEMHLDRQPGPFDLIIPRVSNSPLANLVVVQSESFFDARDVFPDIRTEVLKTYDSVKAASVYHGKLTVPAWGANTVRTEFAFLSGLAPEQLGVHGFNPYRKWAAQHPVASLASVLKAMGYHTICVHPYPASFYTRDKIYPLLGFDEFIDIRAFAGVEKNGPYVGDISVAEKVGELLKASTSQPLFIFVITMENHGPLHLEKVQAAEIDELYIKLPPAGCDDLTIYLRHLRNADQMCRILQQHLAALPGNNYLCWYGDHVPIMPKVYETLGKPVGQTDYLIWNSGTNETVPQRQDLPVDQLAATLLADMDLI